MTDSVSQLTRYNAKRNELITADRAARVDHLRASLSPVEQEADQIIRKIRDLEANSIWTADHPSIPHPFPGMEFLTGRNIIVQTKLFEILTKMPKGALLHAHLDGTVNVKFLLKLAVKQPAIHVRATERLRSQNLTSVLPEFKALSQNEYPEAQNLVGLTDESYQPGSWVPIQKARELFGLELGGPEGFDRWVTRWLTIEPSEAYGTHNTSTKIWSKFQSTFIVAAPLVRYEPILAEYIREFFLSSIADGISYVEPRVNFMYKFIIAADGRQDIPHRQLVAIFDRVLHDVKEEMKHKGREGEFIGARIIYTTVRFCDNEELEWYLRDCIALKKEFPHLIAGFDLVGHEDVLKPLIYYAETLLRFPQMQKEAGVEIPFIFHAGETLGDGTMADMNLYDAILLGTKRIGHGFSLVKHPRLMEICKERDIAVEVCPISNEILRLTSSMSTHPLPILLNNGIHVALCSDDPSVFGNMGLTFDYFQVLAASELTGLIQLGEMAKDSIKYSTLKTLEKDKALALWHKQWEKFLEYVITTGREHLTSQA
ncbi:cecr1 family adenosine [Moniliophthora roreri MCA 2997]|uniref:adenosine deaminase n=2 Tax=Moniliophthora roreri TaxID=221103 RepID=V2WUT5_MONRO|nr:cecr1 family adenosine [Moniliophthora roreri MCA 2997]KAI3602771.1 cecr1 family adenosine [Moniliophthora roreri]